LMLTAAADKVIAIEQPVHALTGLRLLAVDRSRTSLELISQYAHSWGMHVRTTTSVPEALEWLTRGDPFDLAILAESMKTTDGQQLHQVLWSMPGRADTPAILYHPLGSKRAEVE